MAEKANANQVVDYPARPQGGWGGYFHKKDPTLLPANVLAGGSFNCFIPDNDVIVTRQGSQLLGQSYTLDNQIIGHRKKFTNSEGVDYEVRVWYSGNSTQKDIWEVLYQSRNLSYNTLVGVFLANEIITGTDSAATALIVSVVGSTVLVLQNISGTFQIGETITGTTSGATAIIVSAPMFKWWQVTANTNAMPAAVSRLGMDPHWYFDEWFDTSTDSSASLRLSRLIGANGNAFIASWTGGVAQITSFVVNTSISISPSLTWASLGFLPPSSGGSGVIVVNGNTYSVSAGWATNTITVASTSGIAVNDLAFDLVQVKAAPVIFDFPRTVQNHVIYGNFQSRSLYVSNAFNHPAFQRISNSQAVQNDLVLSGLYNSTGSHVYRVTIDGVAENIDTQEFFPSGSGGIDDIRFDPSGYTGPAATRQVYKVVITTDAEMGLVPAAGAMVDGETIIGGTSSASATVVFAQNSPAGQNFLGLINIVGDFVNGEVVTAQTSGSTGTIISLIYFSRYNFYKNDVITRLNNILSSVNSEVDNIVFTSGSPTGHTAGDAYILTYEVGGIDSFQWQIDGAVPVATHVPITGAAQGLSNGVVITFVNQTGHSLGDFWDITVNQAISDAYINFYYTLPTRFPGEGAVIYVPSNFWTMSVQEDVMYVNTQHGQWSYIEFKLSADLLSETIIVTPLKSESSNKVIWPYMIGYLDNNLVYVTENKTLDMIGRKKFVELPQIGNLSDPVKIDFNLATFINGSFEFFDKKLWINSAQDGVMFCFDWIKKYWQPPQVIPENGILSTYQNSLITHSNLRNQTNTLFVGTNDNGSAFDVVMRFPYNSYGSRWQKKMFNMTFVEGYLVGAPEIKFATLIDLNGCHGKPEHIISPKVCIPQDRASLGKASLGAHGLGNDPQIQSTYFQEVFKAPQKAFFFSAIELSCQTLDQQWGILSVGLNPVISDLGNNDLTSNAILIP